MEELRDLHAAQHRRTLEAGDLYPEDLSPGQGAALEVLLVMADADARWGDYTSAVRVLDSVTAAFGGLPPGYAVARRRWATLAGTARPPARLAA